MITLQRRWNHGGSGGRCPTKIVLAKKYTVFCMNIIYCLACGLCPHDVKHLSPPLRCYTDMVSCSGAESCFFTSDCEPIIQRCTQLHVGYSHTAGGEQEAHACTHMGLLNRYILTCSWWRACTWASCTGIYTHMQQVESKYVCGPAV